MNSFKKALIAYMSPAGSTADVADLLKKTLESYGIQVTMIEIGREKTYEIVNSFKREESALFIGSPVYVNRPLPQILEFIEFLSEDSFSMIVPFVTWGGVTSGIALYEMASLINKNKKNVAGALKIPASHSMILDSEKDPGAGHPDVNDKNKIKEFVKLFLEKMKHEKISSIEADKLLILSSEQLEAMMQTDIYKAGKNMPDKLVSQTLCTTCGMCGEICSVGAIEMNPYPEFKDNCIFCFKCVKECPEEAILCDLESVESRIIERRKLFSEELDAVYYI